LKRKTDNKKPLIYFTLTVCLIAGVWKLTNLGTSSSESYSSDKTFTSSLNEPDQDFDKPSFSVDDDNYLKESALDIVNKLERIEKESVENKPLKVDNNVISSMRTTFDCKDSDQVKDIQKALGLTVDGIYGPATETAWKSAIKELNKIKDANTKIVTVPNSQPKEKTVTTKTTTDNLTTLNSTKTAVSSNNSMLD
tara:strand:+ start:295 stop:879 length:585 start_codon:yes stop_codon:yes gene_type:complete